MQTRLATEGIRAASAEEVGHASLARLTLAAHLDRRGGGRAVIRSFPGHFLANSHALVPPSGPERITSWVSGALLRGRWPLWFGDLAIDPDL